MEASRQLYPSHQEADRATALEKLWDAFERLKTQSNSSDKK